MEEGGNAAVYGPGPFRVCKGSMSQLELLDSPRLDGMPFARVFSDNRASMPG